MGAWFEQISADALGWLVLAPFLVSFAGSFLGGTALVIMLATLGGSSGVGFLPLAVGSILGNYLKEICWFALARSKLTNRLRKSRRFQTQKERIDRLRSKYGKRDLVFFIAIKFAYGLRVAQLLIFGAAHYPWRRFLRYNLPAVAIFNALAVFAAWMLGSGATQYMDLFENLGRLVTALVVVLCLVVGVRWLLSRFAFRN